MTNWAQHERAALVAALRDAGPDAPTLCAGWTARDLAAHVVVRERRPDAAAGIVLAPLAGHAERVRLTTAHGDWSALLDAVAAGPPLLLRPVDGAMNLVEMFVHCEDVRRGAAGWEPRALPHGLQDALWRRLRAMARLTWRRSPVAVRLQTPHGAGFGRPDAAVTITGAPGELVLVSMGRAAAQVTWSGEESAVAAARGSDRSV